LVIFPLWKCSTKCRAPSTRQFRRVLLPSVSQILPLALHGNALPLRALYITTLRISFETSIPDSVRHSRPSEISSQRFSRNVDADSPKSCNGGTANSVSNSFRLIPLVFRSPKIRAFFILVSASSFASVSTAVVRSSMHRMYVSMER